MNQRLLLCLLAAMAAALGGPLRAADDFDPIHASLRDRAVVMELAEGVRRVRLRIRQEDGTWKLCTVAHLEGVERYLKLRLPDGVDQDAIEVAASFSDPFPYRHYQGRALFGTTASGSITLEGPMSPTSFDDSTRDTTEEETVEESDIWKWRGSTLYFFNQYRGLQVIDVSDPAAPERLASHRLSSNGEQMYLHPSADLVILLTSDPSTGNVEVVLVRHPSKGDLVEQERVSVPGYILESRMVGSILYVVSRHSFEERVMDPETGVAHVTWRSGLAVTKIDLNDPDAPVADPPLTLTSEVYNYWGAQVQATSRALLVSTNSYDPVLRQSVSTVHVVDISDPDATPAVTHHLPIAGQVRNKFNLRLREGILTVVSQVWRGGTERQTYASVETFDLTKPADDDIAPLGQIEFAQNESITATRFVGDLCYVVTFLRVDPLFVVNLEDPADPHLVGELEIPGFSTYLEPLGDGSLISVGVEDSQIAVSWFDVSDPENPVMSSRVHVGAPDGWSWTEANWDEKAFGFFPDEGLILLPWQGSDPEHGWTSGVQVIEMGDQELIKRGSISHEFRARRARVLGTAIASISGRSLRTLDISDPDDPQILADLILAWPADLVHRTGDWLIQLERGGSYWYQSTTPPPPARLHVSPADDPESLAATLDLGPGRVVGSFLEGDCLWVAQSLVEVITEDDLFRQSESFVVTAVDLSDPENPLVTGWDSRAATDSTLFSYGGSDLVGALLPDGALLWYPARMESHFYFGAYRGMLIDDAIMPYYPGSGRAYTVDIADKEAPRILAAIDLRDSDQHWNEGRSLLIGSTLCFGLQNTTQVSQPDGTIEWRAHHWLKQIDLSDPAKPAERELIKLPGTFEHAFDTASGGIVLYTSHTRSFQRDKVWATEFRVQALAFDGVMAYLLDELVVADRAYGPKVFDGAAIVLGQTNYQDGEAQSELTIYEWLPEGTIGLAQTLRHPARIYELQVSDQLLVAREPEALTFIDFADPGDPNPATVTAPSRYFWQGTDLLDIYQRRFAHVPQGLWGVETIDLGDTFASQTLRSSEDNQPASGPEWTTVDLAVLRETSATNPSLIGALEEGSTWMVAASATRISYEAWFRKALGLSNDVLVPPADLDFDHDGLTNGWEYHTGSHPGQPGNGARPRAHLTTDPDGSRHLNVRLFVNPHAPGVLRPELSTNGVDWHPAPGDIEFVSDPFSPSVLVRFPVAVPGQAVQLLRFSFQ